MVISTFHVACPRCGKIGAPAPGHKWVTWLCCGTSAVELMVDYKARVVPRSNGHGHGPDHTNGHAGVPLVPYIPSSTESTAPETSSNGKTETDEALAQNPPVTTYTVNDHASVDRLDGAALLDDVAAFLSRFVAYPSAHALVAHALWVAHAHLMDAWESTPRIAFLSPEPASGKTRALEVTELLVPRPVEAVNVTPAYLFRKVGDAVGRPTILYDEIDTVFGPKAKDNEEIRGLLNAGYRVGAVAGRCVVRGKVIETEEIPAYCAVALAGLGGLPDTILSRSINVPMRRRGPTERIEPYRRRVHAPAGHAIRDQLARWADTVREKARDTRPDLPEGIEDRDADKWESLFAVAELAGGTWPERTKCSAVALVAHSRRETPSLNVRLLADLHEVFRAYGDPAELTTEAIMTALLKLEEAPWNEVTRGKPLTARGLAQRLKGYGVQSHDLRTGTDHNKVLKGYARVDFCDAWARYLPSPPAPAPPSPSLSPQECATAATRATDSEFTENDRVNPVAARSGLEAIPFT